MDSFPGYLEQAGTEIARDAVVRNRNGQALRQYALIASATPALMALDQSLIRLLQPFCRATFRLLEVSSRNHRFAALLLNILARSTRHRTAVFRDALIYSQIDGSN